MSAPPPLAASYTACRGSLGGECRQRTGEKLSARRVTRRTGLGDADSASPPPVQPAVPADGSAVWNGRRRRRQEGLR